MPTHIHIVLSGEIRLLGAFENEGLVTLAKEMQAKWLDG